MLNLESRNYVDRAIYERERDNLFAKTWQLLGPVSQVAERGQYVAVEIAGFKVFAIRAKDGKLRAFRNLCRHRGARLLEEGTGAARPFVVPIISGYGPTMAGFSPYRGLEKRRTSGWRIGDLRRFRSGNGADYCLSRYIRRDRLRINSVI